MSALINSFCAEIIKSKNTIALWLTVIGAAIIPLTMIITYVYNYELFIPESGRNPWSEIFLRSFNGITLFTPLFLILIINLLFNIENKSNAWKHIFVLPISKSTYYFSKYAFVFCLVFAYYFLFVILTWGSGALLGYQNAQLNFLAYTPEWKTILSFLTRFFVGTLAIIAIHFWLSFRIKNLIANLGIGLVGVAFSVLFNGTSGYVIYFPYSFPIMMLNYAPKPAQFFENYHIISLFYFTIFSVLSYWDFTTRFKG